MAYSDYGGYAYRNGQRVADRSDYTIMPDGSGVGTPGSYPGFAALAAGVDGETVKTFASYPHHHVVMGDGPILVGLHKQSSTLIYRGAERLDLVAHLAAECVDAVKEYTHDGKTTKYVDSEWSIDTGRPLIFDVDGHRLEVHYTHEDNYYQYARLTQPDGAVWYGWSGYGVGAGLEDCGYGYDTYARDESLTGFWPEAIAA